jgi:hypothetical protein
MPVTPFHFGPGLLAKAVVGRYFSFTSFAITQAVIDAEAAYYLVRNEWPVHRACHTILVGTAVGVGVAVLLHVVGRMADRRLRGFGGSLLSRWHECDLVATLIGGAFGGASHSLLDSTMRPDVQPYWPWAAGNPLLGVVGVGTLHLSCVAAGMAAVGILLAKSAAEKRTV